VQIGCNEILHGPPLQDFVVLGQLDRPNENPHARALNKPLLKKEVSFLRMGVVRDRILFDGTVELS